ncbi:M1 family metallopeptidase [Gillisia sp. M10.2A]|uniref:Aminopeptidase N n=1 Tax=Gillisia lutea TaxID=2909668 RepID=A0ABS9EED6_9FLAO|nr:M1 family metallopeptidase [Gillisia lutea]MCF4101225.1 M1 family metallopeptidase [Gillisia lutea]
MKYLFLLLSTLFYSLSSYSQIDPKLDQINKVDFEKVKTDISILPKDEKVTGVVTYEFKILKDTDSIFLDAKDMEFENVSINGKSIRFRNDKKRLWLKSNFKAAQKYSLELKYSAAPRQAMYFINWNLEKEINAPSQVFTQGQGKYTSYWLPSFDDMREKAVFEIGLKFKSGFNVIANGELEEKIAINDSITKWVYKMDKPMSSYLVAVAAGIYEKKELVATSGIPLELYYLPKDSLLVEPTYRHSKRIFDFLEQEIGYAYPWQNYKQIPVQDFLYSGMENTGMTIFSSALMIDSISFKDQNYVNVNAHELAHQWFGDLVTEKTGEHHWLHEGFATYYALLAEREIFGDDYYYWKLYQSAEQLKEMSDSGQGEALLRAKSSSLTYYQKGAWALHILKERVGEKAFKEGVRNYLRKYAYSNVSTAKFISEIEKSSGMDLTDFANNWLKQSAFQGIQALNSLKKSQFIKDYMELAALREIPFTNKKEALSKAFNFPVNDYIGQEAVYQISGNTGPETISLYKKVFESGNVYVRQAIAVSMQIIPKELKEDFKGLLFDDSYITQEAALQKIWTQFPEDTQEVLNETESIQGFPDKSFRMLWLSLALVDPNYKPDEKPVYFKELSEYTRPYMPFYVRQNAFGYLYQLDVFTDENLLDLAQSTSHHTYRYRDFCRKLLDRLLENEEYRRKYVALKEELSGLNREYLNKKLNI